MTEAARSGRHTDGYAENRANKPAHALTMAFER
ncbi:hypothetical protein BX592_12143 [Paraburkholderia rhizosphaerae]|uniref:Uncharacterized protein n=1 Tax=Paraburkholderia rhizosphaerae TaxID=480658 RepID=A0A4R8LH59_9BURK|nr:hypothetical protein BX592_12143 [Paraburkholderia rhizosphaerae]